MCPVFNGCEDTAIWMLRIKCLTKGMKERHLYSSIYRVFQEDY